jgi:hypothetical protein
MTGQPSPIAQPELKAEEASFDIGDYRLAGTLLLPSEAALAWQATPMSLSVCFQALSMGSSPSKPVSLLRVTSN